MKRYHGCYACLFVCFSLVMVFVLIAPPASAADCYKYITFKNESAYGAQCKVTYRFEGYSFVKETDRFPRGQERKVAVPCPATSVVPEGFSLDYLDAHITIYPLYTFFKAEDRCFKMKGTYGSPTWEPCDPPGTPPVLDSKCWKHITLKNEGAYAANVRLNYTYRGASGEIKNEVKTGIFSHGMSRRLDVPCDVVKYSIDFRDPPNHPLEKLQLPAGNDYCFVLKGTHPSPRYELCAVAGEQTHSVAIRNYGAYSAELSVAYDHGGTRMNPKSVIHAQQRGSINVPQQATNVHIVAKAIAGKKILDVTVPTAQSLCYEVRGGTLTPRWTYCPQ